MHLSNCSGHRGSQLASVSCCTAISTGLSDPASFFTNVRSYSHAVSSSISFLQLLQHRLFLLDLLLHILRQLINLHKRILQLLQLQLLRLPTIRLFWPRRQRNRRRPLPHTPHHPALHDPCALSSTALNPLHWARQNIEEVLIRFVEELFFVLPSVDGGREAHLLFFLVGAVGVQCEVVVEGLWFLEGFGCVVELDCNFEFTPAGFVDFEGVAGLDIVDHSQRIRYRLVQLELHFLAPVRDIRIVHTLHKHRPRMRMIRRRALRLRKGIAEFPRRRTIYERSIYLHTLDTLLSIGWCHNVLLCVALFLAGNDFSGVPMY